MSVRLRLTRMGAKKRPFYRIIAADSRSPRDGKFIEVLGFYNPIENPAVVKVDEEKVITWLRRGAIPSDTVRSILRREGVLRRWDEIRKGLEAEELEMEPGDIEVPELEEEETPEPLDAEEEASDPLT